jgi:hypothetical protein
MHSARLKIRVNPGDLAPKLFLQQIAHDSQTGRSGPNDDRRAFLGWAHSGRCVVECRFTRSDADEKSRDIRT